MVSFLARDDRPGSAEVLLAYINVWLLFIELDFGSAVANASEVSSLSRNWHNKILVAILVDSCCFWPCLALNWFENIFFLPFSSVDPNINHL